MRVDAMNLIVPIPPGLARMLSDLHARHWPPPPDRYTPHLTVKMPFLSRVPVAEIERRIEASLRRFGPFHVHLRGVQASRSRTPWLHVVVLNPDVLRAMHLAAYDALRVVAFDETPYLRWFEGPRFTPHVSLGPARDLTDPAAVLAALQAERIEARFRVRTVRLDARDAEGRWNLLRTFPLAAGEQEEAAALSAN